MSTFDCKCATATAAPPDPRKHVNYTHGMVLGVDDLTQEFAYHQNQRQWLARDAIGYGTLSGLRVTFESDLKVHVAPGTALSPRGQLIRVVPEQCALLNEWLALPQTQDKIRGLGNSFPAYVVLCFRDCKVDELPVPGEPCRCEDQAKAPSRILDDFRLELRLEPPEQPEEDFVRAFVAWLQQIKVSSAGSTLDQFLGAIRDAANQSPPGFLDGSPPPGLAIPTGQLCEYLRAALRLWVVELRPQWQAQWTERQGGACECHGDEKTIERKSEECLLLARLDLTLSGGGVANAASVRVDDSNRPFVVHLRMVQEMLLCGPCCGGGCNDRTFATVFALDDHTLRIWVHHTATVVLGESAIQLMIDDTLVASFTITAVGGTNVFDLDLGTSPPVSLNHGNRVALAFETGQITESGSPPRTVAEAQATDGWCYPDAINGVVTVWGMVSLSDGTIPQPSDLTPSAETFGTPGGPGILTTYSRADHVHPLPALPPIPQAATTPPAAENFGAAAVIGVSSDFARADHVHPLPQLPVIPQPATTLPAAETFGAIGVIGALTNFARADHVHPMPALPLIPQAATTTPAAESFGIAGSVGVSTDYARADHVHPIPALNAVEHPPGLPQYLIVAAGIVSGQVNPTGVFTGDASRKPVYADLRVVDIFDGGFRINFNGYSPPTASFQIIVKALPVARDGRFPLVGFDHFGTVPNGIFLSVVSATNGSPLKASQIANCEFMIEISRFRRP